MKALLIIALFLGSLQLTSAQSYYGYKARPATSQVDYAKIGKDMSDAINSGAQQRQAKLEAAGWSSEWEYRNHVRALKYEAKRRKNEQKIQKKQMALKSKFYKGNKKIKTRTDGSGKVIYYQD
jgi:hypothetical protein